MHTLRVCQFNVLAPSARICAPLDQVPWRTRHSAICDTILSLRPELCTLQEFDFHPDTPGFAELYQERLGALYQVHLKKRTGTKTDGLGLLVRRGCFEEVDVRDVDLEPGFCDRVLMLAAMRHAGTGRRVVLGNTHLTVAHAGNDHDIPMCRPLQMKQVLAALAEMRGEGPVLCLCCGDLNADHLETEAPGNGHTAQEAARPVTMAFEDGFQSALHQVLGEQCRPVSHTCKYAQDGCCDYVLYQEAHGVTLQSAALHPAELSPEQPWSDQTGWGQDATLSDHRPLVVDFELSALE